MEMHVLPLAVTPLPDPGLREGLGRRRAVCRYTLIEAKDLNEAVELSKGCPILEREGSVEVRPIRKM